MSKLRAKKEKEMGKLNLEFGSAKSAVFTNFDGLTVAESQELRRNLRSEKVSYQVSKKSLLKKALADNKIEGFDLSGLRGNVGVAFSQDDEVAPAKLLAQFAKKHEKLKLSFGLLEGRFITDEKVKELASLPSKIELIAKVVGSIKAPLSGIVNVLAGNLRGLVNALNAIKDKKSI